MFREVISLCFEYDSEKRWTIKDLLKHDLFKLSRGVDYSILAPYRKSKSVVKQKKKSSDPTIKAKNYIQKANITPNVTHTTTNNLSLTPQISPFVAAFSQPYLETITKKKRSNFIYHYNYHQCILGDLQIEI